LAASDSVAPYAAWAAWRAFSLGQRLASAQSLVHRIDHGSFRPSEPRVTWQSSLNEYPDHVNAIGMISIENANLEMGLAELLAAVISVPRRVAHAIYFTPRAATLRIDILKEAAAAKLAPNPKASPDSELETQKREALATTIKLTNRAHKAVQKRHDVIHDAWGVDLSGETGSVIRQKIREAAFIDAIPVELQSLTDLVRDFRTLIDEVTDLTLLWRKHPPSMVDLRKPSTKAGSSARTVKDGKPASYK
jgi:hypothetical protein